MSDTPFGAIQLARCDTPEQPDQCIVRLTTSVWSDGKGVHIKKSLNYLKRKSHGFNILANDVSEGGADDAISRILNLHDCDDGVYQVVWCNVSRDFESGHIDGYDFQLVKYEETGFE